MAWWDNVLNTVSDWWSSLAPSASNGMAGPVASPYAPQTGVGTGSGVTAVQPRPVQTYMPIAPVGEATSRPYLPTPTATDANGYAVPQATIYPQAFSSPSSSYASYVPQQADYSPYYSSGSSGYSTSSASDPYAQSNWQSQFNSSEEQRKWQNQFATDQFDYTKNRDQWQQGFDQSRFDTSTDQWNRQFGSNEDQRALDNAFRTQQFDTQNNQWNKQFDWNTGFQGKQFDEGVRQFNDTINRLKGLDQWNQGFQQSQFDWNKQQADLNREQQNQAMTLSAFGRRFAPNYSSGF